MSNAEERNARKREKEIGGGGGGRRSERCECIDIELKMDRAENGENGRRLLGGEYNRVYPHINILLPSCPAPFIPLLVYIRLYIL